MSTPTATPAQHAHPLHDVAIEKALKAYPPTATPRTDAAKCRMNISMTSVELDAVPALFACALETELACEKDNRNHLIEKGEKLETKLAAAKAECERLQWELDAKDRGWTAELARLRAEVERLKGALALGQENCDAAYDDLKGERDEAVERAERAEAECLEQARLLGMSGEREAALLSKLAAKKP